MSISRAMLVAAVALAVTAVSGAPDRVWAQGPSCAQYCVNVCKAKGAMGSGFNNCVSQCSPKCEQHKASKGKQK